MPTIQTRVVRGRWLRWSNPNGATSEPATGNVKFTPSNFIVDTTEEVVVLGNAITVQLDFTGRIILDLPVTDDPNHSPEGWYWKVVENIGNEPFRSYDLLVPSSELALELASQDIGDEPPFPQTRYAPLGSYIPVSAVGAANGVAPLGGDGKIPSQYLPD